jgi:hypothetical protein
MDEITNSLGQIADAFRNLIGVRGSSTSTETGGAIGLREDKTSQSRTSSTRIARAA